MLERFFADPSSASARGTRGRTEAKAEFATLGPVRLAGWLGLLGFAVGLAILAFTRQYPGFTTETDLLGGFIPEAMRLQSGAPLVVDFQPPLYSALLALGQALFEDWFRVGLMISWMAAVLTLWVNFAFFHRLFGSAAAWGSAIALMTSATFLSFGAMATSDSPFLLVYSVTLLVSLLALQAEKTRWWVLLLGCCMAAALLTRFNGLPLLVFFLVPWLRGDPVRNSVSSTAYAVAGFVVVFSLWGGYAQSTGSPVYPTENYANLAMTYFGEGDRISIESRLAVEEQFSSTWEVVTHQPLHMGVQYLRDLAYLPHRLFQTDQSDFLHDGLVAFPLGLLALPGVLLLFLRRPAPYPALFLGATILHVLLLNFKTFDPRFYLFLVPLFGAGAGLLVQEFGRMLDHRWKRVAGGSVLVVLFLVGARANLITAERALAAGQVELSEAIPAVRNVVDEGDLVVARKRHIPFFAGAEGALIPDVPATSELMNELASMGGSRAVYLYFGEAEWLHRPGLRPLREAQDVPTGLEPVLRGTDASWVLYRVSP